MPVANAASPQSGSEGNGGIDSVCQRRTPAIASMIDPVANDFSTGRSSVNSWLPMGNVDWPQ